MLCNNGYKQSTISPFITYPFHEPQSRSIKRLILRLAPPSSPKSKTARSTSQTAITKKTKPHKALVKTAPSRTEKWCIIARVSKDLALADSVGGI